MSISILSEFNTLTGHIKRYVDSMMPMAVDEHNRLQKEMKANLKEMQTQYEKEIKSEKQ